MSTLTRTTIERLMEEAVVEYLKESLPPSVVCRHFEDSVHDAEPPLVSVKAEKQQEISSGTGVWEVLVTVLGRDVPDADWAPIEARLLDTASLKAALNTTHMATVDGQAIDYDDPSEREADEEYQRTFPLRIFAALLC